MELTEDERGMMEDNVVIETRKWMRKVDVDDIVVGGVEGRRR